MSFNENNYSVNYLIWDQETIERDNAERNYEREKSPDGKWGRKALELVSPSTLSEAPDGNEIH
jgi:hypothetical protein